MDIFLFILLGACVGILSGYFGIGGGFVLTPILLLLGFSPIMAVATSLLYTIFTSLSGVLAHFRMKNIHYRTSLSLASAGIVATQVAHPFVEFLEKNQIEQIIIPLLYILLAGYFSYSMLKGSKYDNINKKENNNSLLIILIIGFIGGFISTTLGVGGGFIIVPLSIVFLNLTPRKAVGTSLLAVFFIVIAGFITYSVSTPIDYPFAFTLIIGSLIGGQIGAYITKLYQNEEIKKYLGILYVFTVINMTLKMVGLSNIGLLLSLSYIAFLLFMFSKRIWNFIKDHNSRGADL